MLINYGSGQPLLMNKARSWLIGSSWWLIIDDDDWFKVIDLKIFQYSSHSDFDFLWIIVPVGEESDDGLCSRSIWNFLTRQRNVLEFVRVLFSEINWYIKITKHDFQGDILTLIFLKDIFKQNIQFSIPTVKYRNKVIYNQSTNLVDSYCFCFLSSDILEVRQLGSSPTESNVQFATPITKH